MEEIEETKDLMASLTFVDNLECIICYTPMTRGIYALECEAQGVDDKERCGHSVCAGCVEQVKANGECPVCRRTIITARKNLTAMNIMVERMSIAKKLQEMQKFKEEAEANKKKQNEIEEQLRALKEQHDKILADNEQAQRLLKETQDREKQASEEISKERKRFEELSQQKQIDTEKRLNSIMSEKEEEIQKIKRQKEIELDKMQKQNTSERQKYLMQIQSQKDKEREYQEQLKGKEKVVENFYHPIVEGSPQIEPNSFTDSFLPSTKSSNYSASIFSPFTTTLSQISLRLWTARGPLLHYISEFDLQERRGSHRNSPVWRVTIKSSQSDTPGSNAKDSEKPPKSFALKMIKPHEASALTITSFRESLLLFNISHPNIIKLEGAVLNPSTNDFYMKLPFIEHDLEYLMHASPRKLNAQSIMLQLLSAVFYLHSGDISHCDIKPTSIMYSEKEKSFKLTSFSVARSKHSEQQNLSLQRIHYGWAPELLWNSVHSGNVNWKSTDIWSIGCIFAQIISCSPSPLFSHNFERKIRHKNNVSSQVHLRSRIRLQNPMALLKNILRVDECTPRRNIEVYPIVMRSTYSQIKMSDNNKKVTLEEILPSIKSDEMDLLTKMLAFESASRISAHEAIHHDYFQKKGVSAQDYTKICQNAMHMADSCIPSFLKDQCGIAV